MEFRSRGINARDYKIWDDHVDKETAQRLKWKDKYSRLEGHQEKDLGWRGVNNEIELEDFLQKHKFVEPKPKELPKKADYTEDVNEYLHKLGIKDLKSNKITPKFMNTPEQNELDLIYEGISKDLEGRYKYLKERKKHSPRKKFPFPVTSSMEVGWRTYDENSRLDSDLIESSKIIDKSTISKSTSLGELPSVFGLKNVIMTSFYRENGVLSDQWKHDIIKARAN